MERGKAGFVGTCKDCGRQRMIHALGRCASCYNSARQKMGMCENCHRRMRIYAKGECKPCRDRRYRGLR